MDILLPGPGRRVPCLDFDADGPKIGGVHLLAKSSYGFMPLPRDDLDDILRETIDGPFESKHMYQRLAAIARALNADDVALAAIATSQLRIHMVPRASLNVADLRKARVDDPKHPGWPAGTSGGRGGRFRPKDASIAFDTTGEAERLARLERLKARRGLRAVLRKVLTAKRLIRLGLEGIGELVPVLDAVETASVIEDLSEVVAEVAEENAEVDAATAFVEQGPRPLDELTMSEQEESFASFNDFKKIGLGHERLARRFGEAGEGYEYHHIVEQSSGLSEAELNSTSNIVRIPKLLHEEVNAEFARVDAMTGLSLRQALSGASMEARRTAGLDVLRRVGILCP